MKHKKYLYSSGEFAKLSGVNKRTLHYYNDIGLFCPEIKGENGYHYYSCFQMIQLEMILTLRKIGLSIADIQKYTKHPSDVSFARVLAEQKEELEESIQTLQEAKYFLQKKLEKLELGLSAVHGKVEEIHLPEQKILLSAPITGAYDEADFAVASDFSFRLKKLFGLYDNFGSRILVTHLLERNFDAYDSFFSYGREEVAEYEELRPEGDYLRTFCVGGWEKLQEVYEMLLAFAEEHGLTLYGYAYEEGLNEMSLQRSDDYITMITVAFRRGRS